MPAPKIPPIRFELSWLSAIFEPKARALVSASADEGLPMVTFETGRAVARQDWLADKGYSRARGASGPHPWGMAIDRVLDPKHIHWNTVGEWPQKTEGGAAWDTGYELRRASWPNAGPGATGESLVCVRPHVAAVWRRYGQLAKSLGLEWGGVNAGPWANHKPGAEFGWDPAHVQQPGWRKLLAGLPFPT